jgi:hypothetical protein
VRLALAGAGLDGLGVGVGVLQGDGAGGGGGLDVCCGLGAAGRLLQGGGLGRGRCASLEDGEARGQGALRAGGAGLGGGLGSLPICTRRRRLVPQQVHQCLLRLTGGQVHQVCARDLQVAAQGGELVCDWHV